MARIDDQINPTEVVDAIKEGALKSQIMTDYRISDEELAMILLPQFRKGRLTKDEFNDFFRGLPVNRKHQTSLERLAGEGLVEAVETEAEPGDSGVFPAATTAELVEVQAAESMTQAERTQKSPESVRAKGAGQTRMILERIFSKLNSIDERLSNIEEKLESL